MRQLNIEPLTESFGARIVGVDLAKPLEDAILQALARAYLRYKVLLFPDQRLDTDAFVAFSKCWGVPRIDVFTDKVVPGYKEVMRVGNVGALLEQPAYRNGASFWHTDCAAEADPDACTMLYCLKAPHSGGETIVADMQAAYEAMDETAKAEVDDVVVHHCYSGTRALIGGREAWEGQLEPFDETTSENLPPPTVRALARPHTVTGRKGLYSPAGSIFHVEGMSEAKAHELIRRVKLHAIDEAFCYRHRYRAGDLLMWDNTATMHCATPVGTVAESGERLLHRISSLGLPPVVRALNTHSEPT